MYSYGCVVWLATLSAGRLLCAKFRVVCQKVFVVAVNKESKLNVARQIDALLT